MVTTATSTKMKMGMVIDVVPRDLSVLSVLPVTTEEQLRVLKILVTLLVYVETFSIIMYNCTNIAV